MMMTRDEGSCVHDDVVSRRMMVRVVGMMEVISIVMMVQVSTVT
jgi:hypothetical protein